VKIRFLALSLMLGAGAAYALAGDGLRQWVTLFDGTDLEGWTIATDSPHGDTQAWRIEEGAIVGTQDRPGNGGILYSNQQFGDFVLALELNPDWGLDSGIFLRSTDTGKCYQIMVDNYEGGNIGGIYGEGIGGFNIRSESWKDVYRQGEWNRIVAVVTGNPPLIDVWLNGEHVTSYQGEEKLLGDKGHIAVQVHAGDRYFEKQARFRNIRVRELE
jgi:hypothetical protein